MAHHQAGHHEPHIIPFRTNLAVFAALMVLLFVTVAAAYVNLGAWGLPVAMAIATVKALLILLYFMHIRYASRLQWIFSAAAFLWLGIMIAITMSDYVSRGWLNVAGK
jgi:cytochrome c oxidase subunit 4